MQKTYFKIAAALFFLIGFIRICTVNLPWIYSSIGPDFTQVWRSAKDMAVFREPYLDPNLDYPNAYPPISEIFFLPLTVFSHQVALVIFTYVSFAAIIGSVFLSLKIVMKKVPWHYFLLFIGLSFTFFPIRFSLGMGQINMVVLFFLLLAVFLETKTSKKSLAAGIVFGIAIALKPIFAFFLLLFAINKSWKLIAGSFITIVLLISTTLIFWPIQIWFSWYRSAIIPLTSFSAQCIYVYQNQGIFGFASRLFANVNSAILISRISTIILVFIATYLGFKKKDFNLKFSFFIITLLLFDITSWQHHFVWLLFPFVVLFVKILKSKDILLLGLLIFSYLLTSGNLKNSGLYSIILQSNQFYGALILWAINLYFLTIREDKIVKNFKNRAYYNIFEILNPE